ncbi:hypothetical protein MY4824_010125 [Beauveria thailandica]
MRVHFMNMAFLAEQTSEAWKARVEAGENSDITSDREETASGKDDQDELNKERKSKKTGTIEIEWRELRFRISRACLTRKALYLPGGLEAPDANAALSQNHEIVTWTESNRPVTSIDQKTRKAGIIGADYEERRERGILPDLPLASRTSFNFEQNVRQLRSHGAGQKPNLRNKVFRQADMNSVGKAQHADGIYGASERRVNDSSLAFHTRLLVWEVCIVVLAVGAGMTVIICSHITQGKKPSEIFGSKQMDL